MKKPRDQFFEYFDRSSAMQHLYRDGLESPKSYPLFRQIELPAPETVETSLCRVFDERISTRDFAGASLSTVEIGTLLSMAVGAKMGKSRRKHPSGGAKFPIECYPLILKDGDVGIGIYHYHPLHHALEELAPKECFNPQVAIECFPEEFVGQSGVVFVLSFVKERSFPKYGTLAYKLGLLEAGHIGQNFYLAGAALGLGVCALGAQDDKALIELLRLDGINESPCYALAVGRKIDT